MLKFYKPEIKDLRFRQKMLEDEETMSYNHAYGGTISFPEEKWEDWYERWINDPSGEHFYRYITVDDTFIGEAAYHYIEKEDRYMIDVIIYAPYRGKGYGGEALDLLCQIAKENGIDVLWDDIAIDNPAIDMFLKHGFKEICRDEEEIDLRKEL